MKTKLNQFSANFKILDKNRQEILEDNIHLYDM